MKKLLATLAIIGVLAGCKNERQDSPKPAVVEVPLNENFTVEIIAKAALPDDFAMYYTEDGTNNFDHLKASWNSIVGGKSEKVILELPKGIVPRSIRLDFGLKKEQEFVEIESIRIIYFTSELFIKGSEVGKYFTPIDINVSLDSSNGLIRINRKGREFPVPMFYPRQELIVKLAEMAKKYSAE